MGTLATLLQASNAVNPIVPPVAGAVVGAAISALVTGFFVQRHWVRRTSESVLIDNLTKDLDALVEKTLEYWSLDYSGESKKDRDVAEQARASAARIKASIKKLQAALREYSERYCKKVDFTGLMGELHDACTNGAFEAAKRGPDHDRYLTVVNASNRVRSTLFARRL